ncbi:Do family serine endopeptidase [Altererythrobacter fulvus]|uniref:Do family serine endopeptidase n=1 Tax=Caenibius fulvus TaxID=2126012 RepID=UPI003015F0FA
MRYAYGFSSALLIGGAAISLITGHPAGAQVAQNNESQMQRVVPRAGAPVSFADLTEQLQPAVVNISTRQRITVNTSPFAGTPFGDLFGGLTPRGGGVPQTREAQSLGSGFLISADGYVVTNNHVITADGQGKVEQITVTLTDGTEYPATLVGTDTASDLAVLKIERTKAFPFVEFGDSRQSRVGDWVIAIGQPFGLGGTVTAGIISAVYRNTGTGSAYDRYIQTDTSINRGNSGGPLFDMQGRVIGINNAIFSPSGGSVGIGFAIPAETAEPIVDKLIKGQPIERGYLGVRISAVDEDIAASLGVPAKRGEFVRSIEPGEPADKAGLQAGDIVLKVNGQDVTPDQTLSYIVANIAPGTKVPLEILRNGQKMTLTATVGKRPSEEELAGRVFDPEAQPDGRDNAPQQLEGVLEKTLGVRATELTPQIAGQLGLPRDSKGVLVDAVDASADAGRKLQRGDVVLGVNTKPVTTVAEFEAAVQAAKDAGRDAVLLQVKPLRRPQDYIAVRLR